MLVYSLELVFFLSVLFMGWRILFHDSTYRLYHGVAVELYWRLDEILNQIQ